MKLQDKQSSPPHTMNAIHWMPSGDHTLLSSLEAVFGLLDGTAQVNSVLVITSFVGNNWNQRRSPGMAQSRYRWTGTRTLARP